MKLSTLLLSWTTTWSILVFALPHGHRIDNQRKRMHSDHIKRYVVPTKSHDIDMSSFKQGNFKKKRYVAPSEAATSQETAPAMTGALRRRQITGTFTHSNNTRSLKRGWDASLDKVKRGRLHPLLFYTQHYNQALSRLTVLLRKRNLNKRANNAHIQSQGIERIKRRWQDIHRQRGILPPPLVLSERGQLIPAKSNLQKRQKGKPFNDDLLDAAQSGQVTESVEEDNGNILGLDIQGNDIGYSTTFTMGTPGRDFQILVDSGSADLWVPSRQCNQDGDCGGHQTLSTEASSSLQVSDPLQPFQVVYGSGEVQGVLATDKVQLPGGALAVDNLTFGITTSESVQFADPSVPFDGLMGLAISSLSNEGTPTFIEALAAQGLVSAAQMGYHLGTVNTDNAAEQDSTVTFGGVDATKFEGQLVEIPNQSADGFWIGGMDGVSVDGKALQVAGKTAILDTGTSLMIMPQADAEAVHAAIPGAEPDGQGGFTLPCDTNAQLAFTFGGQVFAMAPSDLAFVPLTKDPAGLCQSSISAGDIDDQGSFLLGAAFLKNTYFATDVATNTIGLAVAGDALRLKSKQ